MRHKAVPHEGSAVKADPLQDTTFGAALAAVRQSFGFRWTWAEDEIQRLIAAGWDQIGEGELRYTFNSAEGEECDVDVFAEAHVQFEYEYGTAVRLVPGPVEFGIEPTGACGTPGLPPRCRLEIMTEAPFRESRH